MPDAVKLFSEIDQQFLELEQQFEIIKKQREEIEPVSYTHLTLPTKA